MAGGRWRSLTRGMGTTPLPAGTGEAGLAIRGGGQGHSSAHGGDAQPVTRSLGGGPAGRASAPTPSHGEPAPARHRQRRSPPEGHLAGQRQGRQGQPPRMAACGHAAGETQLSLVLSSWRATPDSGGSLSCSLRCSSPASSTVHGGTRRAVTCTGGRWWTCGNAEQRTLNPRVHVLSPRTACLADPSERAVARSGSTDRRSCPSPLRPV